MQLAPLFPVLHRILKPAFPACLWTAESGLPEIEGSNPRQIALTFDDGPHPLYTPQLLQVLKQFKISASFFWLGACVDRFPAVAKAVYDQGHWIGLHGYDHRMFPQLSPAELKQSLQLTQAAIAQACQLDLADVQANFRDVRPPNGLFTPQTLKLLGEWNFRPVMWSVVTEDWARPGISVIVRRVLEQIQNGSLIVLHDGHFGGQDVAEITYQLIPILQSQGYEFLSVDQFWQSKQRVKI